MSSDWERWEREKRLEKEEHHRLLQQSAIMDAAREKAKNAWYSRECPECAEIVKRKAKVCKECNFEFEDWEEHRKDIEHWEERGAKVEVDPWEKDAIEAAEYRASPEGQAEQRRKEEEEKRKKEEEKAAREEDRRRQQAELDERKRKEAAEAKQKELLGCIFWILMIPVAWWLATMYESLSSSY